MTGRSPAESDRKWRRNPLKRLDSDSEMARGLSPPTRTGGTVAFLRLALRGPAYSRRPRADFRFGFGADFRSAFAVFGAATSTLAAPLAFTSAA
jgi:hypothetical protein